LAWLGYDVDLTFWLVRCANEVEQNMTLGPRSSASAPPHLRGVAGVVGLAKRPRHPAAPGAFSPEPHNHLLAKIDARGRAPAVTVTRGRDRVNPHIHP
jgi:hypothetical protein